MKSKVLFLLLVLVVSCAHRDPQRAVSSEEIEENIYHRFSEPVNR